LRKRVQIECAVWHLIKKLIGKNLTSIVNKIKKKNKNKMTKLNNNIKDMLIGCILGDAHIGKVGNDKGFITFEQTIKHKDYVIDIYNKLEKSGVSLYELKYYSRKDSRYNSLNSSIYFKTSNSELLYPLVNMFLSSTNIKILPLDIEKYLNPITLAY
jgi:LAGLIDADG DNA endonuclease family